MKRIIAVVLTFACLGTSTVVAEEKPKPVKGEDLIEVPAIGEGLFVHNLFQSNMVLQRDKPIKIWGWANPGETVTVAFAGASASAIAAADRSWKVELPAQPASSEPRSMTVAGKDSTVELENILVGDVWLCGGQSNMEFEIAKLVGGALEIQSANFPQIRLLTVPQQNGPDEKKGFPRMHQWSGWSGRHFRRGDWDVCSPETVPLFSGIGYIFARRVYMATQVPIGMIDISRGGTCIETWLPMSVLASVETPEVKASLEAWNTKVAEFDPQKDLENMIQRFNERTERLKKEGKDVSKRLPPADVRPGPALDMNRPGNCYASIVAPLEGLQVTGALWHQGFNNAMQSNGHVMYYQLFARMIESWRLAFDDPAMPFGIISLCTAGNPQSLDDYVESMANEGIYIREVQYKTFRDLQKAGDENIGFASSYDQRRSWYHPQIKIPVGERIAKWALATQYGLSRQIKWEPPVCQNVKVEEGTLVLTLNAQVGPYNNGPILGFAVAGEDGKFQPATANYRVKGKDSRNRPKFDRASIVLSSALVPNPVHYRHAWGRNPMANLRVGDIPFATQRSDSWTLTDMYRLYLGKDPETDGVLSRAERGAFLKVLRAEDLQRRLHEAETLIKAHQK